MKHTPGPWEQRPLLRTYRHIIYGRDNSEIAEGLNPNHAIDDANTLIMAAGPDLLKELRHLVMLLEPLEQSGDLHIPGLATLNGPRAAIAKAEKE